MSSLPDPTGWLTWWSELWRETYSRTAPLPSLAPQALSQPILPGWLFANSINVTEENSSSPETEREIVAKNSYGRQLGRIIDVLSELIDRWPGGAPDDPSVQRFAALRDDIEKSNRICLITSSAVKEPIPALALSNTARTGLWAWSKTAAQDLQQDGVTLNLACPGYHATDRLKTIGGAPGELFTGDPADFGKIVAFMCSEPAGFISGAALQVDGAQSVLGLL